MFTRPIHNVFNFCRFHLIQKSFCGVFFFWISKENCFSLKKTTSYLKHPFFYSGKLFSFLLWSSCWETCLLERFSEKTKDPLSTLLWNFWLNGWKLCKTRTTLAGGMKKLIFHKKWGAIIWDRVESINRWISKGCLII